MALFIDGPISTMEDLTAQDTQLTSVASSEGIDVTKKLELAHEELGIELASLVGDFTAVVVTPALRLWHTFRTLMLVYGDAYYSQLNDRYKGKRDEYEQKARWAFDRVVQAGIGITMNPVRQAATPVVSAAPGIAPDGTYFVTMAWVNGLGEEGACAIPASLTIEGSGLMVTPGAPPDGVSGWNVYAGTALDTMVRQNASPLAPGQPWMASGPLLTTGDTPGTGQYSAYTQPADNSGALVRLLLRG
jgi:hypothetical protein